MSVIAIIPAAGIGTRMGHDVPKQFLSLNGTPIFVHTLRKFAATPACDEIILGVRREELDHAHTEIKKSGLERKIRVVEGGGTRQETVGRALAQVAASATVVLVHDAVRPFVTPAMIEQIASAAAAGGAAIFAIPSVDTVKQVEHGTIAGTVPRERIALAQTPQAFRYSLLCEAFNRALADGFQGTDESSLVERLGASVTVLMGSPRNIKITKPSDLPLARLYLAQESPDQNGNAETFPPGD
ncbi:MAG: 2-C-methyl-D-erythritol 4-phosphate cytidylyltransferase [Acidobacteriota bacterium]|nr:2-C-methyl-D-erythritol 4-phosphate cytidylyltransferase [Acidobacteriota bacterium]